MVVTAPTACSCRPRGLDGGTLATGVCVRRWVLITGLGFLKWVDSFFPRAAAPNEQIKHKKKAGFQNNFPWHKTKYTETYLLSKGLSR